MFLKALWEQQWFKFVVVLLVGVTIGALFYPTKRIEEKITQKYESQITTLKETHLKEVKDVQEKLDKVTEQSRVYKEQTEHKITTMTSQMKDLQSKQKTSFYKIVRPDGTIEIKKFSETEVNESSKVVTQVQEEFKKKVEEIETKWETIHKERVTKIQTDFQSKEEMYKKEISELKSSKVTEINKKSFGLEAGITTDKNYYGHATADLWGPIFVGLHGQLGEDRNLGIGLGLRF